MVKLTNNLIPVLSSNDLEEEATIFLQKYYPEALATTLPVPIKKIATDRLGLTIITENLSEDFSAFGLICFNKCKVEIYKKASDEYTEIIANQGTIIIDPDTFYERTIGCVNNTIAHECYHWFRHRAFYFALDLLEKQNIQAHRCDTFDKDEKKNKSWNEVEWSEWQANRIAPRILMPKDSFKEMADIFYKNRNNNKTYQSDNDWIAEQLSIHYCVSILSAKIRLDELSPSLFS